MPRAGIFCNAISTMSRTFRHGRPDTRVVRRESVDGVGAGSRGTGQVTSGEGGHGASEAPTCTGATGRAVPGPVGMTLDSHLAYEFPLSIEFGRISPGHAERYNGNGEPGTTVGR